MLYVHIWHSWNINAVCACRLYFSMHTHTRKGNDFSRNCSNALYVFLETVSLWMKRLINILPQGKHCLYTQRTFTMNVIICVALKWLRMPFCGFVNTKDSRWRVNTRMGWQHVANEPIAYVLDYCLVKSVLPNYTSAATIYIGNKR
jgi:hypothetical protein